KSGSTPESQVTPLFSAAAIGARIQALADEIAARGTKGGKPLVLVGLLRGAIPFVTDLARALSDRGLDLAIDYASASSYGSAKVSSGQVTVNAYPSTLLEGRDVLIADDILDTGLTLAAILEALKEETPLRLSTCVLLDKRSRRINGLTADFVG